MSDRQPASAPASVILCADDYALTARVSQAILDLLSAGRLSATGAMTNRPGWPEWGARLKAFDGRADLGLHLNLTCGAPLTAMPALAPDGRLPSLGRVATRACTSAAARREIAAEIAAQLDAFVAVMGRPPDFVDGHQHVHVLPSVRGALMADLSRRGLAGRLWLRDPADRLSAIVARGVAVPKALVIAALAAGFGRRARAMGFATNHGFAGVSPFDPARDFGADMARFLSRPGRAHLVMVHPGGADDAELAPLDPVIATRPIETAWLLSDAFPLLLAERGLHLARGPRGTL